MMYCIGKLNQNIIGRQRRVDNISDSFKLDTIDNTIREFKNNPSYKSATLIDYNLDETPIDIRIVNEDKSPSYKRFHFLPETEVNVGSYIKFDDKCYLVKEYEYNIISPFAKVVFCNQTINFADGTSLPCTAEGESYGVDNLHRYIVIYIQYNLNCWKPLRVYLTTT